MQEQTAMTKHGQLVTTLFNRTVNSSHDYRLWRVELAPLWAVYHTFILSAPFLWI